MTCFAANHAQNHMSDQLHNLTKHLTGCRTFTIRLTAIVLLLTIINHGYSQDTAKAAPAARTEWYRKLNIRGYAQLRYNRLFETNNDLQCEQCDRSWGGEGGFFFRRIRLIFYGQVHERVYVYIQPDFASSPASGVLNFAQIRDAYFDVGIDRKNQFRL